MTDVTSSKSARRPHHWRRELVELAAVFTAVAVVDMVAKLIAYTPDGPFLLLAAAVAFLATAGFHIWWARRHSLRPEPPGVPETGTVTGSAVRSGSGPAPGRVPGAGDHGTPAADGPANTPDDPGASAEQPVPEETVLRRLRTTVRDEPGSLAALCGALADLRADVVSLQTHPLAQGTVDEFLLRTPASLPVERLREAVVAAGGTDVWTEHADAHDLVDTPTRVLELATRTALDAAELPLALRRLLGRCTIRSRPAVTAAGRPDGDPPPVEGVLEGTVIKLRDPRGGTITVERHHLPFTPAEFARARALMELDARLGPRTPDGADVLTLPRGEEIVVRRADQDDLAAAKEMQARCSDRTLRLRYHGPAGDAHRYLDHLLNPRHGRTLAVETSSGLLVGLGHLLWDGDETEVALLVEDDWQRRGIGSELLKRLVALARDSGSRGVYAVTQSSNTAMVAAMRGLQLPLDYQVEEGTLVITARPEPAEADLRCLHDRAGR
ncbi:MULTISPECIES: GNAT family N-acetyltransferase [Streptomyces]|uniref:GNAT family N-acetyltransferase n=1 Tax=Streptomyces tsukubensis (strain DSM 42081 / NBRC 108919 / NRRL 18488 / 9993) TaxID=1114943 RepID=A0A7G3UKI2_STRT9|nr:MULTISPECIES: GNAT family N-acetyltransferase [Streptomyces]AZK93020.1 GNAT family N-acetyltransferase [Streptomyces tsukubensis]MYS67084.1 GNAT family N-acetyltransferase [Streptomyces sp. SID5473]QKM70816.1 GNAT family N-acetyltransferase [Streptomyces tsukubensis NRRL18488]TAI41065.1 GNAT family N-acetyltransferase [Streptomyces tsukubensis]